MESIQKQKFDGIMKRFAEAKKEDGSKWDAPVFCVAKWRDVEHYMGTSFDRAEVVKGTAEEAVCFLLENGFSYGQALMMLTAALLDYVDEWEARDEIFGDDLVAVENTNGDMCFGGFSNQNREIFAAMIEGVEDEMDHTFETREEMLCNMAYYGRHHNLDDYNIFLED